MTKSRDAFRTISEVADWLDTPAHVLRFWESKFPQIKPVKRAGGRRYYRPEDMALLGGIKTLLHEDGLTIKGAQKVLRDRGVRHVSSLGPSPMDADDGDREAIESQVSDPAEDAAPAETPAAAWAPPETPAVEALPAFLRRAPGMGAPRSRDPEAEAAPEERAIEPAAGAATPDDLPAPSSPDDARDAAEEPAATDATAPEDPPGEAPDAMAAAAPSPEATAPEPPATGSAAAPQPAIPETADLVSARAANEARTPKDPRVIHETHDPGAEWQPELPFGSLRPTPEPAKRPARAVAAPAPAGPESAPRPGLLSILAGADLLAADPARLAAALTRLEALRDRPRS